MEQTAAPFGRKRIAAPARARRNDIGMAGIGEMRPARSAGGQHIAHRTMRRIAGNHVFDVEPEPFKHCAEQRLGTALCGRNAGASDQRFEQRNGIECISHLSGLPGPAWLA